MDRSKASVTARCLCSASSTTPKAALGRRTTSTCTTGSSIWCAAGRRWRGPWPGEVRMLGATIETIRKAEDRQAFKQMLEEIGEPVPVSRVCESMEAVKDFAAATGLPLVIRPAYTLGGTGGGFVTTDADLDRVAARGLAASPIHQVLIERSLWGWKEIEYEVMRDSADTCITVCNMENLDPMGVHTGDSIVVAPV